MARFPIDNEQRKTGSRACAIVHYKLDSEHWLYREETEQDVGRDCIIELSENNAWMNHKIECQIKGTKHIDEYRLKTKDVYSFPVETKTIMYALSSNTPFVLFLVDIVFENVYYLPIQDCFIANKSIFEKLFEKEEGTINLHIPIDNTLSYDDNDLQKIAKSTYIDGPTQNLRKA